MTRGSLFVAVVTTLCLGAASHAAADAITITEGSIVFSEPNMFQGGSISVTGTRGFSLNGFADSGEGRVDPLWQCFPCEPTPRFSVGIRLGTFAIAGALATLDGKTYSDLNGLDSSNNVFLSFEGSAELPRVNGPALVIGAPFTVAANSFFQFEVIPGTESEPPVLERVGLRGRGTATASFVANPTIPVWEFNSLRYDFQPVPEPATLALVGGGLLLFGAARRRRGRSS